MSTGKGGFPKIPQAAGGNVWARGRIGVGEVMGMVGRLVLAGGKGRFRLVEDRLGPLEAVRAAVYAPEGLAPWRL